MNSGGALSRRARRAADAAARATRTTGRRSSRSAISASASSRLARRKKRLSIVSLSLAPRLNGSASLALEKRRSMLWRVTRHRAAPVHDQIRAGPRVDGEDHLSRCAARGSRIADGERKVAPIRALDALGSLPPRHCIELLAPGKRETPRPNFTGRSSTPELRGPSGTFTSGTRYLYAWHGGPRTQVPGT
jgi:hypothetical protein